MLLLPTDQWLQQHCCWCPSQTQPVIADPLMLAWSVAAVPPLPLLQVQPKVPQTLLLHLNPLAVWPWLPRHCCWVQLQLLQLLQAALPPLRRQSVCQARQA